MVDEGPGQNSDLFYSWEYIILKHKNLQVQRSTFEKEIVVVTASDLSPKYISCVPWFIEFWKAQKSTIYGIRFRPLVIIVSEEIPSELLDYSEYCQVFKSTLPGPFVSQNIRTLFAGLIDSDLVVTSDVDMLPMNSKVIDKGIAHLLNSKVPEMVILRDVLPPGQFPICYSLAAPNTWNLLFPLQNKGEIVDRLESIYRKLNSESYEGQHGGYGWFTDQEILYQSVTNLEKQGTIQVQRFQDKETGHRRLDRIYHRGLLKWLVIPLIQRDYYSDYHVHHPVWKYKRFLSYLLKLKQKQS